MGHPDVRTALVLVLVGAIALGGCRPACADAAAGADLIITGGPILTMDGDRPTYVEAVVVDEGRIAFVGAKAEALRRRGARTRVRDLGGRTLLPGFIDAHSHFINAPGLSRQVNVSSPPVGPATDIPSTIATLQAFQAEHHVPEGGWIVGWGYDRNGLAEGRDITRLDLDAAFPTHKVMLLHVSLHGAVFNSKALEWAGVTAHTPTPAGGVITRLPGGREPAGLLMETAYLPVFTKMPQPGEAEMLELMRPGQMMYAANGYTLANEGFTHVKDLRLLQKAAAGNRLFIDIVALPGFTEMDEWLDRSEFPFGTWHGRLKLQGIKITQDGSPQGRTAHVSTPFLTGGPAGERDWRGETTQPEAAFAATVKKARDHGLQIFIHANGDATIDQAIRAVEAAGITAADDARTVVVHSQFQRSDHLPRYRALGMSPTYFTNHAFFWGDAHRANIGPEKAAFISPMKAAVEQGLVVSNHSDFNVTPLDPMFMLWTSMARRSRTGTVVGPDQRVDAHTGLQALTTGPAWQFREEDRRGRIRRGLLADFVILSADPVASDESAIRDIRVVETIKEGKTIYPAGGSPAATGAVG
jgi:hypothetical protein